MADKKRVKLSEENGKDKPEGHQTPADWDVNSWRKKEIKQQPEYEDKAHLRRVVDHLGELPPIVQCEEVQQLKGYLAEVSEGKRFILQGGDCAERFQDCTASMIQAKLKIMLQMSLVLVWGARVPLVRIGRIAGQYMKPRTKPMEKLPDGSETYSYKGDSINGFEIKDRKPDPDRLLQAYFHSTATMNYLRGLLNSGFADLHYPSTWDLSFVQDKDLLEKYSETVGQITHAMNFMSACGVRSDPNMSRVEFFSSHEGMLLEYEGAMTNKSQIDGLYYNQGAHFLWIGDRTRQLDHAHVEYFRGIQNPIGCKAGPTTDPKELVELIKTVNPSNEPGKITIITRFGATKVHDHLPAIVDAVVAAGLKVVWECDPMHGNTRNSQSGLKTREFQDILTELLASFDIHASKGTWLGGVHFELTGNNVTECTGGATKVQDEDLPVNYESFCDPRLNYHQSLEMAFLMAEKLGGSFANSSS